MNERHSSSKRIKRYKKGLELDPEHQYRSTIMQTEKWSPAEKKAYEEATIRHLRHDVEVTKLLIEQKLQVADK